jgi:hypothetical protein
MDSLEFQPQEIKEQGEGMESVAARSLDDATFEPLACVEQMGNYQQAEAVQTSLEAVVASLPTEQVPSGELPAVPEAVDTSQLTTGTDKEPGGEGAIPISIPGVSTVKEDVGTLPTPLPEPAVEVGEKWDTKGTMAVEVPLPGTMDYEKDTFSVDKGTAGTAEIPLPGTGEAGYKEDPERLNVELPQQAEPLTGVGNQGNVDAAKGSDIGVPLDMPLPEDLVTGSEAGQGSKPVIYGNVPGHGGTHYGESDIPGDPTDGMSDMPTEGGPSSSGGGPPIMGGFGGYSDEPSTYRDITVTVGGGKAGCDAAADRAVEVDEMEWERKMQDGDGASYISKVTCKSEGWVYEYSTDHYGKTQQGPPVLEKPLEVEVKKKSQEVDDSNPTPYTGGGFSSSGLKPEKENDTGRVLPDADLEGFDGAVWTANPETADDSGRFYGGIKGDDGKYYPDSGGARPIDPKRKTEDESKANEGGGG